MVVSDDNEWAVDGVEQGVVVDPPVLLAPWCC